MDESLGKSARVARILKAVSTYQESQIRPSFFDPPKNLESWSLKTSGNCPSQNTTLMAAGESTEAGPDENIVREGGLSLTRAEDFSGPGSLGPTDGITKIPESIDGWPSGDHISQIPWFKSAGGAFSSGYDAPGSFPHGISRFGGPPVLLDGSCNPLDAEGVLQGDMGPYAAPGTHAISPLVWNQTQPQQAHPDEPGVHNTVSILPVQQPEQPRH